jgi:uncharacterized repeat protein (TIGR03803 family)
MSTNYPEAGMYPTSLLRGHAALVVAMLVLAFFAIPFSHAQTFTVVHTFTGGVDGSEPIAPLISDSAGNLYSTTYGGGADGDGVVFKLDSTGKETVLHYFSYFVDGQSTNAGLVRDAAGNLYGATPGGDSVIGGAVFKLDPTGRETILHKFTDGPDGAVVFQSLLLDAAGNLYGSAFYGGDPICQCGTVFKIDAAGHFSVLHTFTGTDGANPYGTLIQDGAGNLYGTTQGGGTSGIGTVFEISTSAGESVLHSFTGGADGASPNGGLFMDAVGNLYGTTYGGGSSFFGIVYEIDTSGTLNVLHTFTGPDGANPRGQLVQDAAGTLYGTTYDGTRLNGGTVYKLDITGTLTILHRFTGGRDGSQPYPGVLRDAAGNLYGTTFFGGALGGGVVYKISL